MATNIKGTTIASSYDRIVLVDDDGADIGSGTTTKNIEIQTSGGSSFGVATATAVHLSTDRVGIGTAAPGADLHIEKDATTGTAPLEVLRLDVKDAGVDLAIGMGPKLSFYIPHNSASFEGAAIAGEKENADDITEPTGMSFFTAADGPSLAERVRITGSGDVGIGTKTPDGKLELSQDSADCNLIVTTYDDDSSEYSSLILRKSDGTEGASGGIVADDDILGAIRFEGLDNDSGGIFLPGAEIIARINGTPNDNVMPCDLEFHTNTGGTTTTQRMTIYEGGNVNIPGNLGLGTATSPSELLHLKSATAAGIFIEADTDNASQEDAYIKLSADNTAAGAEFAISSNAGNRITGGISANVTILGSTTANPVQFFTDDIARLNILANGNVGINCNDPVSITDIRGPAGTGTATPGVLTLSTAETTVRVGTADQLGRIDFRAPLETGGTDAILAGASIGAVCEEDFAADNNSTGLFFSTGTTAAPSERMRINRDGYVGIGTTAPVFKIDVSENEGQAGMRVIHTRDPSQLAPRCLDLDFNYTPDNTASYYIRGRDDADGTPANEFFIYADGSYAQVSDVRKKENIIDAENTLDKINQLRVVNYNKKNDVGKSLHIGMIAQEVQEIFPHLVVESDDEMKSLVMYKIGFVHLLVKAVQELSAKVTALENA